MSVVIVDTDVHAIIALSAAVFATVRGRLIAGNLRGIPCGDLDHLHTVMTMLSMTENVQETGSDEIMVYSDSRLEVTKGTLAGLGVSAVHTLSVSRVIFLPCFQSVSMKRHEYHPLLYSAPQVYHRQQ